MRHAERVAHVVREHGVKRAITVDPHTTNMLRTVYPRVVPGFDVKVQSYLEVLLERQPKARRDLGTQATFHDSCLYARSEGVLEPPRRLLAEGGVRLVEPELSGKLTFCCGGPLETLFPGKSSEVARRRVAQLSGASPKIITACPLCLANLSRTAPEGVEIRDISDYLSDAYLVAQGSTPQAAAAAPGTLRGAAPAS